MSCDKGLSGVNYSSGGERTKKDGDQKKRDVREELMTRELLTGHSG